MDFLLSGFSDTAIVVLCALLLDRLLGEPRSWHPLTVFARWADCGRKRYWLTPHASVVAQRFHGVAAWCFAVFPVLFATAFLLWLSPLWLEFVLSVVLLYVAIGWQSLRQHATAIAKPLHEQNLPQARAAVARIVSRDTRCLDEVEVTKAGIESVLENGSDAIFAPIFWFVLLGPMGAVLYRLSNTLDAMWGYKTSELLHFGWCAARIDDVLNYLPARLVVLTYAVCGDAKRALSCAWYQGRSWKSPNAGPVMAAGAGTLRVSVGGHASYFGETQLRPVLGKGSEPVLKDLEQAVKLVDKGVYLWALIICLVI